MPETYDLLIKAAKVFDGSAEPVFEDIAIIDGRIAARGQAIPEAAAKRVIDGGGKWAMPGLFDIHTHYDLELEVASELPESVRHGTTTVVIGNCSLGLAFGAQRKDGFDPIVDCYARVENIPKKVLGSIADGVDWETPAEYLEHLDKKNLGPNVVPLFPHSMLRTEVMGFEASISQDPSNAELDEMLDLLEEAISLGYAGLSTDALPFHYLANQPNTDKVIPTQYASYDEIKKLTSVLREKGAVWQATPPKDDPKEVIKNFLLTSGRVHGKPLKTTVVAAMDVASNRRILPLGMLLARFLNSRFLDGRFYLQALAAPFKTWADGAVTPLAEEIPELRDLNELDLEDIEGRSKVLNDPDFIARFKKMWLKGKSGFSLARLQRKLRLEGYAFNRDIKDMVVEVCPVKDWEGLSFWCVYERIKAFRSNQPVDQLSAAEKTIIQNDFLSVEDEADFVLQMLRTFDLKLSWSTISANRNLKTVRKLLMDPDLLPGFNDSGAHLTNMAFYDCNLRALRLAAEGGDKDVAYMVRRLTRDAADVFGVSGGTINVGDQADIILVDPVELEGYEGEEKVARIHREEFGHEQLVNRSDGVVPLVVIGGDVIWEGSAFSERAGKKPYGKVLRAGLQAAE